MDERRGMRLKWTIPSASSHNRATPASPGVARDGPGGLQRPGPRGRFAGPSRFAGESRMLDLPTASKPVTDVPMSEPVEDSQNSFTTR